MAEYTEEEKEFVQWLMDLTDKESRDITMGYAS
jgi:hypothetical protein